MTHRVLILPLLLAACSLSKPAVAPSGVEANEAVDTSSDAVAVGSMTSMPIPDDQEPLGPALPSPLELVVAVPPSTVDQAVPSSEDGSTSEAVFALRRGESLAHFARWSGLPVEVVAESSGLDLSNIQAVGTQVLLPLDDEACSSLEAKRAAHHIERAEGYLESRGGSIGTEFHVVRTGESAWTIARNAAGIPLWLLETYNPSVELDALRPGQRLMMPILADTVADVGLTTTP